MKPLGSHTKVETTEIFLIVECMLNETLVHVFVNFSNVFEMHYESVLFMFFNNFH